MTTPDPKWSGPVGLDCSFHQGSIDWSLLKGAGYDFAFIKATEGVGYMDPKFRTNWKNAQEAGLLVGAYHFARVSKSPTIQQDARKEADWFASIIDDVTHTLPPVLDIEWDTRASAVPSPDVIHWCDAFLQQLTMRTLRTPAIYTGPSYWRYRLDKTHIFAKYPLWVANYSNTAKQPKELAPWPKWTFWQWSSKVVRPDDAKKKIDANRFNGTLDELKQLSGQTVPVEFDPDAVTLTKDADLPPYPDPKSLLEPLLAWWAKVTATNDKNKIA